MGVSMVFVISSPRSGSTMLERMLEAHSQILGGPEPHLLTPLAHLGVWAKVDKAPYDHILAAEAQRLFVERLPNKEQDYWDACRAYCDVLYGRLLATSEATICLDKTPAYALILPFLAKIFPDAKYVVLTRHPLDIFASYANSFFDGNYETAHAYNPILLRYVPAIAAFLRQSEVPYFHVRYEDLVTGPESWMKRICEYVGVPFEPAMINYGEHEPEGPKGLGDPITVAKQTRPVTEGINKWVNELSADAAKLEFMRRMIQQLDPEDLKTFGYPLDTLWKPFEDVAGRPVTRKKPQLTRYRLQRKAIVTLRALARRNRLLRRTLEKVRLASDVLLRE